MDFCKNSDYMAQATLAQVAILVQTITRNFLKWTGRCCLYPLLVVRCCSWWLGTVSLTINLGF